MARFIATILCHIILRLGISSRHVRNTQQVMEQLGEKLTDGELDDMMKEADGNGDGFVSKDGV